MSKESLRTLPEWFQSRPRWLQFAVTSLSAGATLDDELISRLEEAAIGEAEGAEGEPLRMLTATAFEPSSGLATLRLVSISEPRGINALAPRRPLQFGDSNLSIVYGQNGSGKSGYTRLLKHLSGAPRKGTLHPNVFAGTSSTRGCKVSFERDGSAESREWEVGAEPVGELRGVLIFDAHNAEVYVSQECEVTFEPPVLNLFTDLVRACDAVSRKLDARLQGMPSTLAELPMRFGNTVSGGWYGQLAESTSQEELEKNCSWSDTDANALREAQQELREPNSRKSAQRASAELSQVRALLTAAQQLRLTLEDSVLDELERLRNECHASEEAARLADTGRHSLANLPGIGETAWFALWDAARKYSERIAYPQKPFPNVDPGAQCILCHQELDTEAAQRLQSFDSFVQGELVQRAERARAALEAVTSRIGDVPDEPALRVQLAAAGIHEEITIEEWLRLHLRFRQRRNFALAQREQATCPPLPSINEIDAILRPDERRLSAEAAPRASDVVPALPDPAERVLELDARRWVADQRAAIEAELARRARAAILNRARQSAATGMLSRKKGELADELVSPAFQERFRQELGKLKGQRLRIKLERTRVDRGRALHQMRVDAENALPPPEVLSEGERRVIGLAAFLADAAATPASTPFIFDDPISSLDQDFEEAVVERLLELSRERQVIVFTHRLSLLALLQEAANRAQLKYDTVCVRAEPWGTGEPADVSLDAKPPIKALTNLRVGRLARARNTYRDHGTEEYAPLAKAICSDFRILLERFVEVDLLGDVVQRFRRAVHTQGKLHRLTRIGDEDVALIDALMTKYSIHEHSQPRDSPVQVLLPEEIDKDMQSVIEWHTEFSKRASRAAPVHLPDQDTLIPPASGEVTRVSAGRASSREASEGKPKG